jgi:hypothetical protein
MTDDTLSKDVSALRAMLTSIDGHLQRAGSAPEGLEDLKGAIDNLRTSVWAILSAGRSSNYKVSVERFRLRRATDVFRGLIKQIDAGEVIAMHPEHPELQLLAQQLVERIGRLKPAGT